MVEIDGTVPDDQGLAGDGGKNDSSGNISNNCYLGRNIRRANIGIDTVVSEIWTSDEVSSLRDRLTTNSCPGAPLTREAEIGVQTVLFV
jgi:hypothetical protein